MTAVYLYIRNNNVENRITLKFSVAKKIEEQNICCKFAMRKKKKKKTLNWSAYPFIQTHPKVNWLPLYFISSPLSVIHKPPLTGIQTDAV